MNVLRLGELADVMAGLNPREVSGSALASEFPLLQIKDIDQRVLPRETLSKVSALPERIRRFQVYPGDVVVTTRGLGIRSAVIEESHAGSVAGANLAIVRPRSPLAAPLLAAFLRVPKTQAKLLLGTAGAATPGFTIRALADLEIRVPPNEHQEALLQFLAAAESYRDAMARAMQLRQLACDTVIAQTLDPQQVVP